MKAVIFLGPTLPVDEARKILDAIYLPPVEQAGLVSAVTTYQPDVIGVIDGKFLQSLSVWHKEILFAIEQGVLVYGASSMGALRAAETDDFGMIGVGEVYRMYASGEVNDDDEVALAHGQAETGYRKVSEPMINVRATLRLARDEGVIDDDQCRQLIAIAKSIYFPNMTFHAIFEKAQAAHVPESVLDRLAQFVEQHYRDIKREDAILLLETIRDLPESLPKPIANFKLSPSVFFHTLYNRDRTVRRDGVDVSLATIANYAALHLPDFAELNFDALNRALVRVLAELLKVEITHEAVGEESFRFRYRYNLRTDEEFTDWLKRNDLSHEEFNALMHEIAVCRALHQWLLMRNTTNSSTRFVLDELRWKNHYEEWANAATIQEQILRVHHPMFKETGHDDVKMVDLVEDHLRHSGSFDGVHFTVWAEEAGFHKQDDLKAELLRSKLMREYLEKLAAQLGDVITEEETADPGALVEAPDA
jgi:hypothetical protein